jgi:50S ribosomal subunit-associated GTPase HflX
MSPANTAHERRIQALEATTSGLSSAVMLMTAKSDTILSELRTLGAGLTAHVKEDSAVHLRVHDIEKAAEAAKQQAKEAASRGRNVQSAIWLAGLTVAGDVVLQLLTHLHLIP